MPVTDQQMRALAFLAAAARPVGAKTWDESGIVANIAKVRDRSLGSVCIAVIQAAEDRNAQTPGVIATTGPHWRNPEAAPTTEADKTDPDQHCAGCGKAEHVCRARHSAQHGMDPDDPRYDDHEFVTVAAARGMKRDGETVHQIVQSVKAEVAPTPVVAETKRLDDLLPEQRNPKITQVREQLAAVVCPTAAPPNERTADA